MRRSPTRGGPSPGDHTRSAPRAGLALLALLALVGVATGCGGVYGVGGSETACDPSTGGACAIADPQTGCTGDCGEAADANGAAAEAFGKTLGGSCAAPQILPGPDGPSGSTTDAAGDATGDTAGGSADGNGEVGDAAGVQIAGRTEIATFAAGCFWGVEAHFEAIPGVVNVVSGYTGGTTSDPTYEDVLTRTTGHAEAVRVEYDPDVVSYEQLVEDFFTMHDPTTEDRQGPDVGDNYRSAIFTHTPQQLAIATEVRSRLESSGAFAGPIVTEIETSGPFWAAEDYHQDYYRTAGIQY